MLPMEFCGIRAEVHSSSTIMQRVVLHFDVCDQRVQSVLTYHVIQYCGRLTAQSNRQEIVAEKNVAQLVQRQR